MLVSWLFANAAIYHAKIFCGLFLFNFCGFILFTWLPFQFPHWLVICYWTKLSIFWMYLQRIWRLRGLKSRHSAASFDVIQLSGFLLKLSTCFRKSEEFPSEL